MPFSTDNAWPARLLKVFEIFRESDKPLERRYYGPYDKLLNYCFRDPSDFIVAPQKIPNDSAERDASALDFVVFFIVSDAACRPVFVAEIKDDSWANHPGRRLEADQLLRRRYDSILSDCPLPRLWGMSLLSTSVWFYCGDVVTGAITPRYPAQPHEDYVAPQDFLEGEWNLDILSQEGFNKMKEIVLDITAANGATICRQS